MKVKPMLSQEPARRIEKLADFGALVQARRQELKMSQETLSMLTGVRQPNLSQIERGLVSAQLETCLRIMEALGVDLVGAPRS